MTKMITYIVRVDQTVLARVTSWESVCVCARLFDRMITNTESYRVDYIDHSLTWMIVDL